VSAGRSLGYLIPVLGSVFLSLHGVPAQGLDRDADGVPDAVDDCADWPNPDQLDTDGNGIGNECECGDQDGNGRVDVADLVAINLAIFDPAKVGPLCDASDDGACDVRDIVAANHKIFGATAYCSRYPNPSRVDADGDGFTPAQGDCDDTNASIAPELVPIDPDALAPVVAGACEEGPQTPDDCSPGVCFQERGAFRDFRETNGCSNPVAIDPNNPSGAALCPTAAFATGDAGDPRGCDLHDFCYRTCGSSRAGCDQQFLRNLQAICESLPPSDSGCVRTCRDWAQAYFDAVENAPAAQEAWLRNQGLYCACCGGGACGDGTCDAAAGERPASCASDCAPAQVGAACVGDGDCASGKCSFAGRCIQCGDGRCDEGEYCGVSPGCRADCGLCGDGRVCRGDADCQSGFCDPLTSVCTPCRANGQSCARDAACCSDICNNTLHCASCRDNGQGCLSDDVCCSGICNAAFQCASCKSNGQPCLTSGACCSGLCNGSFVCANCRVAGGPCSADRDCCSGNCTVAGVCGL